MATETRLPDLNEKPASSEPRRIQDEDDEKDGISLVEVLDLLIVLKERWRTILGVTGVCVVLSLVAALVLPKRYTASIVLLPPQQNSSIGSALTSQLGSMGGVAALAGGSFGIKNPNDMYVAMLKGQTVEDAMVKRFELMKEYRKRYQSDARRAFEKHASVDGSGKDNLIHISVVDSDPRRAAELANGYVEEFRSLSENLAMTEAAQRRLFFERQLLQAKDNLANAEDNLKVTEQKTGLIQLDSQARALIESAAALRAQIAAKEVQIQGMQAYATGENAQVVQAQNELDSLRTQLARLGGSDDLASGALIVPKGKVPEAGIEYVRKLRDVKYYETIFDILARQFEVAKLDEAKEGALIQVVDAATPPDRPSFPKLLWMLAGGFIAGLLLGTAIAFAGNAYARMKQDPVVMSRLLHLGKRA